MVNAAGVVNGTVWVNAVDGVERAAADIAPVGVIACVTVKLVTVPIVVDIGVVGATVVAKFAADVVWLELVVSVRR